MDNLAYLEQLMPFTKFEALSILGNEKARCVREDGKTIFVYGKGRKRYGYRYPVDRFLTLYNPIVVTDEMREMKWKKDIRRALKEIDRTLLWQGTPVHEMLKDLLNVSYRDREILKTFYFGVVAYKTNALAFPEIAPFVTKYPFMFDTENGEKYIKFDFISEISDCHLRSIVAAEMVIITLHFQKTQPSFVRMIRGRCENEYKSNNCPSC